MAVRCALAAGILALAIALGSWSVLDLTNVQTASHRAVLHRPFWAGEESHAADLVVSATVAAGIPVVLTESPVAGWPALRLWTPSQLAERLHGPGLPLVDESDSSTFEWSDRKRQMGAVLGLRARRLHDRVNVSARDFFGMDGGEHGDRRRYRQLHGRLTDYPQLASLSKDAQPRSWIYGHRPEGAPPAVDDATLWVGEAGTVSHTHYDAATNFYVQVHGLKRFELWPSDAWRELALYPHGHPSHRRSQHAFDDSIDSSIDGSTDAPTNHRTTGGGRAPSAAWTVELQAGEVPRASPVIPHHNKVRFSTACLLPFS
jgi:hypothetical protein